MRVDKERAIRGDVEGMFNECLNTARTWVSVRVAALKPNKLWSYPFLSLNLSNLLPMHDLNQLKNS